MSDRAISGMRLVPYKLGTHPIEIMYHGWADVLTEAEGDEGWMYMEGADFWPDFVHGIETRIVRTEPTISVDHRFAIVATSGLWVDGDGDRVTINAAWGGPRTKSERMIP